MLNTKQKQFQGSSKGGDFLFCRLSGSKDWKSIFVSYPLETRGYFFYKKHENKLFVARDAVFLENMLISKRQSGRNFKLGWVKEPQIENEIQDQSLQASLVFQNSVVTYYQAQVS